MEHLTAPTSAIPFAGEDWFDPLEDAIRFRVRAFIEALVAEEAQAALGGRERYQRNGPPKGYRNGHRQRQLVGTFGALTVSLPRVRLRDGDGRGDGHEKEWRSQTIQAYKRPRLTSGPGLQAAAPPLPATVDDSAPPCSNPKWGHKMRSGLEL